MWRHVVIEGHCFSGQEPPPCNRRGVSTFCLGSGKVCPHFAFADSNEREAAYWVPAHLVVWDKLVGITNNLCRHLRWHLWGRWTFKPCRFDTVVCSSFSKALLEAEKNFPVWFKLAQDQEVKDDSHGC